MEQICWLRNLGINFCWRLFHQMNWCQNQNNETGQAFPEYSRKCGVTSQNIGSWVQLCFPAAQWTKHRSNVLKKWLKLLTNNLSGNFFNSWFEFCDEPAECSEASGLYREIIKRNSSVQSGDEAHGSSSKATIWGSTDLIALVYMNEWLMRWVVGTGISFEVYENFNT